MARPVSALLKREQQHIAELAATAAAVIAKELDTAKPGPLLEHIPALDALADLARWATSGAETGALTGRGIMRLAQFRDEYLEAFQAAAGETPPTDEDLEAHDTKLEMFDRAIAIAGTKDY